MPGRKAKPTQLKILDGNPGNHKLNKNEPKPKIKLTDPPPWFNARQVKMWEEVIHDAPKGLLKKVDRAVVEAYICAYLEWSDLVIELRSEDAVIETRLGGIKPNPKIAIKNAASKEMLRAAAEMGFTPSSRSKVTVDASDLDDNDEEKTPFGRFRSV